MDRQHDLPTLLQRLAGDVVKLLGRRLDLARVELREDLGRVLVVAAGLLLGVVAAGIGLVMVAIAATDLLRPLVRSREARMLLVGLPLVVAGGARALVGVRRLAREQLRIKDLADELRADAESFDDEAAE
jgi:uncharacterized membrane protein YqjE